jgi:hypothetical protein
VSFLLSVTYDECHILALYAECRYAECHYAKCRYAECRYSECRYAECHYTEYRGTQIKRFQISSPLIRSLNHFHLSAFADFDLFYICHLTFAVLKRTLFTFITAAQAKHSSFNQCEKG